LEFLPAVLAIQNESSLVPAEIKAEAVMREPIRSIPNERGFGRSRSQKALAVTLAVVFLGPSLASAAAGKPGEPRPKPTEEKPTLRERVLKIPAGAIVVVRLRNKEKVKGRLGEVTDEAFMVQTAEGNLIEKRSVNFQEVKSIKTVSTTGHKVGLGLGVAGVAIGAAVLGILIWALAAAG
jgi:hypothetical protein